MLRVRSKGVFDTITKQYGCILFHGGMVDTIPYFHNLVYLEPIMITQGNHSHSPISFGLNFFVVAKFDVSTCKYNCRNIITEYSHY